jgi:ATP-dependent Clp protease ATP-binding subunit ClpA
LQIAWCHVHPVNRYEVHHGVRISDDALIDAAVMSDRYISDRFLPDKAIDLVDEAAAKVKMEITSKPEHLDELDRKVRGASNNQGRKRSSAPKGPSTCFGKCAVCADRARCFLEFFLPCHQVRQLEMERIGLDKGAKSGDKGAREHLVGIDAQLAELKAEQKVRRTGGWHGAVCASVYARGR